MEDEASPQCIAYTKQYCHDNHDSGCLAIFGVSLPAPSPSLAHSPSPASRTIASMRIGIQLSGDLPESVTNDETLLASALGAAFGIDPSSIVISEIYKCPGDNRCGDRRRLRRLSNGTSVKSYTVIVFEVKSDISVLQQLQSDASKQDFASDLGTTMTRVINEVLPDDEKIAPIGVVVESVSETVLNEVETVSCPFLSSRAESPCFLQNVTWA